MYYLVTPVVANVEGIEGVEEGAGAVVVATGLNLLMEV